MDKNYLLNFASSDEEKLSFSKIYDLYKRCDTKDIITFTQFLTPNEISTLSKIFINEENIYFFGGYDDAERKIMSFSPFYKLNDIKDDSIQNDFPIIAMKISTKDNRVFSHRDYLGSVLSLGIKREKIGDIIIFDNYAVMFLMSDIAEFLLYNFTKIAHSNILVEKYEENCYNFIKQFKEVNFTVSSLRLDAVISAFTKKSRSIASDFIKKGLVSVNHIAETNVSKVIKDGDVISVRGYGKAILSTTNSLTKKGRINITIKYYV